jgi:hypothetical protein
MAEPSNRLTGVYQVGRRRTRIAETVGVVIDRNRGADNFNYGTETLVQRLQPLIKSQPQPSKAVAPDSAASEAEAVAVAPDSATSEAETEAVAPDSATSVKTAPQHMRRTHLCRRRPRHLLERRYHRPECRCDFQLPVDLILSSAHALGIVAIRNKRRPLCGQKGVHAEPRDEPRSSNKNNRSQRWPAEAYRNQHV